VPANVTRALDHIVGMANHFEDIERQVGAPVEGYWSVSRSMVEPMWRWMQGEHASVICKEYDLFEGNLIRSVMKVANMLDEWLSMATYCQHTEQIQKITETRSKILHGIAVGDSLYLRL
jgi:superfamily II RNA helicase